MRQGGRNVLKPRIVVTRGGTSFPAPKLTSPGAQVNSIGDVVNLTIVSTNVTLWSAINLPPSLSINPKTGIITGLITATSVTKVTVKGNGPGGEVSIIFEWAVAAVGPTPTITKPANQTSPTGKALSLALEGTNVAVWSAEGLPVGLTISSKTGVISGTPTTEEIDTVTITGLGPGGTATTTFTWETEVPGKVHAYGPQNANEVANEIYGLIEPLTYADQELGFPLLKYLDGIGLMWDDLNKIIRDRLMPNGVVVPGYSMVMNLNECPENWLPWLGQFTGVTAPPAQPGLDRELIMAASGMNRGTPAAIKAWVAQRLTGQKRCDLFERSEGKAYKLVVVTYAAETPNEAEILQGLLGEEVVPAGIKVELKVVPGWIYEGIQGTGKTYQQLKEEYSKSNYEKLLRKEP